MNGSELVIGTAGLGVLLLGIHALSRLTAAVVRWVDFSPTRTKVLAVYARLAVMVVGAVLSIQLYLRYPLLDPVVIALESATGVALVRGLLHGAGTGAVVLASVYAVSRGITPTIRDVLEQRHTVAPRHRRRLWIAHAALIVGYPTLGLAMIGAGLGIDWISVALVPFLFGWFHRRNPLVSFAYRTRDPTAEERSRIERCFERFDRRPPTVVLFDDPDEDVDIRLDGHGDGRFLWLNESVLSTADDDELTVLLSEADGKNRGYYHARGRFSLAVLIVALSWVLLAIDAALSLGLFGPVISPVLIAAGVGAFVAFLANNWSARRCVYRADRETCSRLDPDLVRRTYDRFATAFSTLDPDAVNAVSRRVAIEPPVEDRIRRIEREHSLEPMTVTHTDDDNGDWDGTDAASSIRDESADDARDGSAPALVSPSPAAFARIVADLRAEWGRECTVIDSSNARWIDVRARTDDGADELLRTIHSADDEPVTRREIDVDDGFLERSAVDSVFFVTNGRFDESVRALESEPNVRVVEGPRLIELLEEADLASRLRRAPDAEA